MKMGAWRGAGRSVRRGSSAEPKFLVLLLGLKSFTPLHTASHTRERTSSAFSVQTKTPVDGAQKYPTLKSLRGATERRSARPAPRPRRCPRCCPRRCALAAALAQPGQRRSARQEAIRTAGPPHEDWLSTVGSCHSPMRWETGPCTSSSPPVRL